MSRFAATIPAQTPLTDKADATMAWHRWFRDLGDDWVAGNTVSPGSFIGLNKSDTVPNPTDAFHYTTQGVITYYSFAGILASTLDIWLPFTVLVDSPYTQSKDSVVSVEMLAKGAKKLTVPPGDVKITGWYFSQLAVDKAAR